jgi:hypothetical protein
VLSGPDAVSAPDRRSVPREDCSFGFDPAVEAKPAGRFMIRSRTRVVKRHPEGDW